MLDAWFVEGAAELPKPVDELEAETDRHLGTWNEQGGALCNAFLDDAARAAARRGRSRRAASASRDHSCHEPT